MTELHEDAGPSPFERSTTSGFRRVLTVALPILVVAASLVVTVVLTRDAPSAAASAEHNHATPAVESASPVMLDAEGARRIGVTFAAVSTGALPGELRSVGQVTWDETRTTAIAPKVDGWVERLHVNFTGQDVTEGEALLDIYAPMLVTAQEELLLATRLVRDVAGGTPEARRSAEEMLASARRRLQYWDIPAAEVERIERTGQVSRALTLRATSRGAVVEKNVVSGQRIMAGETLYRLADLSQVWVDGQIFEQDLALVRVGQRATVEIQAFPGERWHGFVTYVHPLVDATTRTARIRVELANPNGRLKPGMFAEVHLSGALRTGVLSVPRSAVLVTGQRVVVFVRTAGGMLEPREVIPGAAGADRIEIRSGLVAGDTVVASATFLVDAESNMKSALGSMANMPGMDLPPTKVAPSRDRKSAAPMASDSMPGMMMDAKKPPQDHPAHGGSGSARPDTSRREK